MRSDSLLVVFSAGMIAVVLAMVMVIQILLVRMSWNRSDAFEKAAEKKWSGILAGVLSGHRSQPIPTLAKIERLPFMRVWLHLHASIRGDSATVLNAVALQLGCDKVARNILLRGDRQMQIVGILVSGCLKDKNAWQSLVPLIASPNSIVSMQAASAMLKIDGPVAMQHIMEMTFDRTDWSIADVAHMLQPIRHMYTTAALAGLMSQSPRRMLRALRLLQALKAVVPLSIVEALLHQPNIDLKVAALRIAACSGLREVIKKHGHDVEWPVRVAVAKAMRQVGTIDDLWLLKNLAGDASWWVRYRAAEALVHLPALTQLHLQVITQTSPDSVAQDILQRVITERDRHL